MNSVLMKSIKRSRFLRVVFGTLACAGCFFPAVDACTIFVLTDSNRALFCNNEDWSNPKTRIWFVPGGEGYDGCAYVGFDNGWAQGGLNTKGLAFDWVAGFKEEWQPGPEMRRVRGNSSQRMLETCATVEDAVAYYREHREPAFSYAKILVADRTGTSVIIGAKDGRLHVEKANLCRGFGYGQRTLDEMLARNPEPTVASGANILRACVQNGQYATKYSNVFDLKSGDISLFLFPDQDDGVHLNLGAELKKGGHYYDIPQVRPQLAQATGPLLNNMRRFILEEFKPIPDKDPKMTKHLRALLQDALTDAMRPEDYTAEFWKELSPKRAELQSDLKGLGNFVSMTLVDHASAGGKRTYRYRLEFEKVTVLQLFVLDKQNKVALLDTEGAERKLAPKERSQTLRPLALT